MSGKRAKQLRIIAREQGLDYRKLKRAYNLKAIKIKKRIRCRNTDV
jgi:hypothetical protein